VSAGAVVQIVGTSVACASGVQERWRDVATWVGAQLRTRFGEAVQVEYYDLFDPQGPALPDDAQLPLVLVNGSAVSSGGKVSVPVIRRQLEALGVRPSNK
jgi:disulfide oxidoreductase YuzD